MKKIAATTVLVIALGVAVAGCSTSNSSEEHAAAAKPEAVETTAGPTPTPVDPDQEFVDAMKAKPAYGKRLAKGADQMEAWLNAESLDEGSVASHDLSETYDWLAQYADDEPTSADSPVAQESMETFRFCRDTFENIGTALDEVDVDGMDGMDTDLQECTRGLEGVLADF